MPRGISSLRKRPITSPWLSVLTSSPGITISLRLRASSTVSSAPAKTLWSVTAIAPTLRPLRDRRAPAARSSSRAIGACACGGDHDPVAVSERIAIVVRRRGQARHRRPSSRTRFELLCEPVEVLWAWARASLPERVRSASSSTSRATEAAASSGCRRGPRGPQSHSRSSSLKQQKGTAAGGRHEDGCLRQRGVRRASRLTSDFVRARSRTAAGMVGRRVSGAVRASTISQPGSVGSSRNTARATGALAGSELDDDQLSLGRLCETPRCRLREGSPAVVAGISFRGPLDGGLGGPEERVDTREELRPLVLAGGDRDSLGRKERRGGRRLGLEQGGRRKARQPRLESVDDVERTEPERRRRGWHERPSGGRPVR